MPINFIVKLAATVAIEALQMGLQASKKTYGPRLSETQVTTADYGTPLPRFLGARRFSGQIVWSKDLDIVNHSTKIKGGGKQETQSAEWTAGVAFADVRGGIGPIDKVLKIWLDETLAYDATGTGPKSFASTLGFDLASVMRIYTGAEDQEPDPAYVDFCEARYSSSDAPAFRGTAMLVFDRMPLDNFGNRPPQISVLATCAANDAFPFEQHPSLTIVGASFSGNRQRMVVPDGVAADIWDVPTRTRLFSLSLSKNLGSGQVAVNDDGSFYACSGAMDGVYLFGETGVGVKQTSDTINGGMWKVAAGIYGRSATLTNSVKRFDNDSVTDISVGIRPAMYFDDADGDSWAVGGIALDASNYTTGLGFFDIGAGTTTLISGITTSGEAYALDNGNGQFFVYQGGKIYLIDKTTFAVAAGPVTTGGDAGSTMRGSNAGDTTAWIGWEQYSTVDLSLIVTVDPADWGLSVTSAHPLFDRFNDAMWTQGTLDTSVTIRFLLRNTNAGVSLGDIVSKMCDSAGLADRDTSALTDMVLGYSWTRGDVKSQMEPLLDIHDVDARPHDFTIEFKPRGTASSGTILTRDFAKQGDENPRYKTVQAQDTDLPRLLRVNFADSTFDQEENNALSPLPADTVDTQRDAQVDLTTYADTPAGAQQKADRYMRRQWNGRDTVDVSLTAQQIALEPGDVKTLDLDGVEWNAKLEKQTLVGGRMDCSFRRDETAVADLPTTGGPTMDGRDGDTIPVPAPIKGFVVDAPYRYDTDDDVKPLLYSAAGAYASLTFPGATIWERTGTGDTAAYDELFATVSSGATWGLTTTKLAAANPNLWDRGNTVTLLLQAGSLASVAEADIDADPTLNLLLIGQEYVNFTTATLNGDGSYTLSGFKRGRRGTEWARTLHVAGEAVVLADSLDVDEMGLDQVGGILSFKTQALGRSLDAAQTIDVDPFTGASLKPYAPSRIKWTTDGTDMFGEIVRRTRVGGSWIGGSTIPLSETTEAYEVDIYNGATLKRTIEVSGTNLFTYTGAQISADGNTVGVAPTVNAYQMSDAVGRGFALAA